MDIIISNSSDIPIYLQISDQIKNLIISGSLLPGDKLPSIRLLAKDLGISVITTKNAYLELESTGYIKTVAAKGSYVALKNVNLIKEEQLSKIESLIDRALNIAKMCHISKEEIISKMFLKNIMDLN